MSKYKLYTVYKTDGTKIPVYGKTISEAMDNAGWDLEYITDNVRDYREGMDNSLIFVNGKWHQNDPQERKEPVVDVPIYSYNKN